MYNSQQFRYPAKLTLDVFQTHPYLLHLDVNDDYLQGVNTIFVFKWDGIIDNGAIDILDCKFSMIFRIDYYTTDNQILQYYNEHAFSLYEKEDWLTIEQRAWFNSEELLICTEEEYLNYLTERGWLNILL